MCEVVSLCGLRWSGRVSLQVSFSWCVRAFSLLVNQTSMVDDEQLLAVSGHADRRPRKAEDFSLDASDGKQSDHQRAGGDRRPALTQTQRLHVLPLRHVHHPLLVGVPGGEVEALQLTVRGGAVASESTARARAAAQDAHLASSSVLGQASSTASWEMSAMV